MNAFTDKKDDFLVEMTLLGSDKAFEELVVRYEKRVKGTAYKVTKNTFSAEDASQDAFVCAWAKLGSLKDPSKFGSWVCSIAKNCAVNLVRHYKNAVPDISYELLKNTDLADELDNIADILIQERNDTLHEAVDALSERIREAVKLHYFEGLSVEEIAKKLDLPTGTVKWRLSEGRRQLRKEYGVMEDSKNVTFVQKVMYQVEQLKLWGLKNDKTGFEKEYRQVLKNVEDLEESTEKQFMLADVLARGYWWIDKEANEQMFSRIKEAAEKSLNEEIMQFVISKEFNEAVIKRAIEKSHEEDGRYVTVGETDEEKKRHIKISFMENTQAPYLIQNGFKKALGYLYFWLAHELCSDSQFEKGIGYYKKVLETLTKKDAYYAAALGAVHIEERKLKEGIMPCLLGAHADSLQYKDGKLYLTEQPGYSFSIGCQLNDSVFWNCSTCDCVIFDESLKEGESVISSDKKITVTCKGKNFTVETPSGKYENCVCYVSEGEFYGLTYCETYFCPQVGIVKQISHRGERQEWQLKKCRINGGSGIVPLADGNRWEYCLVSENDIIYDIESVFETVSSEKGNAMLSGYTYAKLIGYNENTWRGNMVKAKKEYYKPGGNHIIDIRPVLEKAESLAESKREKLCTSIARNVMDRMLTTDTEFNPDYTERGYRNFFNYYNLRLSDGKVTVKDDRNISFEWKGYTEDEGFEKIVYDYFYYDLSDIAGTLWSDKWTAGYKELQETTSDGEKQTKYSLEVFPEETVKTKAGEFKNCRHIRIEERRCEEWQSYKNGVRDYWFAPGIGIVKYSRRYKDDPILESVWELTEYRGKGDGYFPVKDGLFRRYVPQDLKEGWHGWVEYTFDEDESGFAIFKNTYGTCDRGKFND